MYKLLAIDIDDTLINDDKQITPGTRDALTRAMQAGVTVTLATGRMYASAKQLAAQLDLNVPLITYQGSLVKNAKDENVLYERSVPAQTASYLYELSAKRGLHIQAYVDDQLYAAEANEKLIGYCNISNVDYRIEPDLGKLAALPSAKLLIIDEPDLLDGLREELLPIIGDSVHITKSKPHYLEFVHKEATKGHALRFLAGHFGCTMEETIAIGDSWNDREMIEAAGLGVAMGNAVDSLKEIADYVTKSNNEDGVKHVVETFILSV